MLYRAKVFFWDDTKHINAMCEQNVQLLIFKPVGASGDQ